MIFLFYMLRFFLSNVYICIDMCICHEKLYDELRKTNKNPCTSVCTVRADKNIIYIVKKYHSFVFYIIIQTSRQKITFFLINLRIYP